MALLTEADILYEPAADHPGWSDWSLRDASRFNTAIMGRVIIRRDSDQAARVRMFPERRHSNLFDGVHGGVIVGLVDISLFATLFLLSEGGDKAAAFNSRTVDVSTQFMGAARFGEPLDSVGELLNQSRRLAFLRGKIVQGDTIVAGWTALIRKPSQP